MDWLRHIVGVLLGSLLAQLSAHFLRAAPLLLLTVTLVTANPASAACHEPASCASELPCVMQPRAGFDALASAGRIGESVPSLYDNASDDAVAARATNISAKWGRNRLEKELRDQGYIYDRPTKSGGGQLYRNASTGEEVRIMPRPSERFRNDPAAKHETDFYYRYRSGPDQPWGPHTAIADK